MKSGLAGRWPGCSRSVGIGAGALLAVVFGWVLDMGGAIAQPGSVMQIPVPAPQTGWAAAGNGATEVVQSAPVAKPVDVLQGEPLAMPGETVPVGRWAGRAGVKKIALAEMPWMGRGSYAVAMAVPYQAQASMQAQYRVVVATPSEAHTQALKRVMPAAITLEGGRIMQAGAFADWRRANALRRALGTYGFLVEVQGM